METCCSDSLGKKGMFWKTLELSMRGIKLLLLPGCPHLNNSQSKYFDCLRCTNYVLSILLRKSLLHLSFSSGELCLTSSSFQKPLMPSTSVLSPPLNTFQPSWWTSQSILKTWTRPKITVHRILLHVLVSVKLNWKALNLHEMSHNLSNKVLMKCRPFVTEYTMHVASVYDPYPSITWESLKWCM